MNNQQSKEDTKPKEEIVYKFSNKGQGQLREAGIIEGKPYFIRYNREKGFIQIEPKIIDVTPILRPPLSQEYPNNNPYEFKTNENHFFFFSDELFCVQYFVAG